MKNLEVQKRIYTLNFKDIITPQKWSSLDKSKYKIFLDEKNNICAGIDEDITFEIIYKRYIDIISDIISKSIYDDRIYVNYAYLDLGLVPLIYLPSFFQKNSLVDQLFNKATKYPKKINPIILPNVSFLVNEHRIKAFDYWIKRHDAASILGVSDDKVTWAKLTEVVFGL